MNSARARALAQRVGQLSILAPAPGRLPVQNAGRVFAPLRLRLGISVRVLASGVSCATCGMSFALVPEARLDSLQLLKGGWGAPFAGRGLSSGEHLPFGSKARGADGPDSDHDLLVIVPDDARADRTRGRLAYEVLWGTGTAVDVIVWTRSQSESRRHVVASLPASVLREGKLLYAA